MWGHRVIKRWQGTPLKWRIVAGCVAVLMVAALVINLYMASWLLRYVNHVLADIPGYEGSAEAIHIDLYRSAYRIDNLVINKKNGKIPVPFVAIETTDFSLQWGALFHGRIVSDAELSKPVINFAINEDAKQTGAEADWTKPIQDLMPIDINYVRIKDGSITYKDFSSSPQVNIYIHRMNGEVRNLRNVVDEKTPLPSTLNIRGSSIGGGDLKIEGRMNILKPTPDMDILLALENVSLPALNDYSEAYASFTFKEGEFNLYSQLADKDNRVTGYIKPIARHMAVDVFKTANPLQGVWEAIVATVLEVFTNQTKDQFATRADLEGDLGNIGTDFWSTLGGIISNAFIQAMSKGFDEAGEDELLEPREQF